MYVNKFGSGKNVYVRLLEAYRDPQTGEVKKKVVKNFGRYDDLIKEDPDAYEKLKAKYKQESEAKTRATANSRLADVQKILAIQGESKTTTSPLPLLSYGHYVCASLWEELALPRKINYMQKTKTRARFSLNAAISYLCFMKVLDPASILFRFDDRDNFIGNPVKDLSLDNLYQSLDFVKDNKDELMKWINVHMDKQFGKTRASMVFYDVTNAYFESPLTDSEMELEQADFMDNLKEQAKQARDRKELPESCFDEDGELIAENLPADFLEAVADEKIQYLKMRGPSKEHRHDLPIVSIAMIVDKNGFPMDFEVYSGNDSEFQSMGKAIKKFEKLYDIEDITVSADRGINSVTNLKMLKEKGFGFLVAQKVSQFSKELTAKMLDESRYTPYDPANPEAGRYQIIEDWVKQGKKKEDKISCTLVLTYNEKRRRRDEAILNAWKDLVEKKMAKGVKLDRKKSGWASLAAVADDKPQEIIGINQEAYEQKLRLCGYAAIVYDASEKKDADGNIIAGERLGPSEIASSYKRQCAIEECFRIMKSHLGLRPMYVWTSNHIRGHVTICVLALLLLRMLQDKLQKQNTPMTIPEICRALKHASVVALPTGEGEDDVMFLSCERRPSLRKGREHLSTDEIGAMVANGQITAYGITTLMTAVGLQPLPRICSRSELARCLGTRFPKLFDAIPELCWQSLR